MIILLDLATFDTPWREAITMTALVFGLIAIGAFLELCDELITWCLGRFGVVLRIDLYQDDADARRRERRRRLELDAASGRVR